MAWLYDVFVELFGRKREPRTILRVGVHWSDFPLQSAKGGKNTNFTVNHHLSTVRHAK